MTSHRYVKQYQNKKVFNLTVRFVSYIMITLGFSILFWVLYPIISFEIGSKPQKSKNPLTPQRELRTVGAVPSSQSLSENLKDFIQIQDWFPTKKLTENASLFKTREYYLTIPKLQLTNSKVSAGNEDLNRNLVHFQPTTEPGTYGTVNIFGHSTLPQLYDPKNYKSIFTHLPDLSIGDLITLTFEGVRFEYEVYEMFVVKPEDVSVLNPQTDGSYVTLITCVPPGTYYNRLVVKAKLKHLPTH